MIFETQNSDASHKVFETQVEYASHFISETHGKSASQDIVETHTGQEAHPQQNLKHAPVVDWVEEQYVKLTGKKPDVEKAWSKKKKPVQKRARWE
jgi:hypothetical protein